MVNLKLNTQNAAFIENPNEIKDILNKAAQEIQEQFNNGEEYFNVILRDSYGNKVGDVEVTNESSQTVGMDI